MKALSLMPGRHRRCSNTPSFFGLGEMMNMPGILNGNPEACSKVAAALNLDKPVDGHAPLCTGADLEAYARAGIHTDHECTTSSKLRERISLLACTSRSVKARSRETVFPGSRTSLPIFAASVAFCTDDRHLADTLERGHINGMLAMAVEAGIHPVDAVRMATLNTAECYGLQDRGVIAPGRRADLLLLDNLDDFCPLTVWTKGRLVARNGSLVIGAPKQKPGFLADTVRIAPVTAESFDFKAPSEKARMIGLLPHSLITEEKIAAVKTLRDDTVRLSDNPGCVKLAVVERHRRTGHIGTCLLDPAQKTQRRRNRHVGFPRPYNIVGKPVTTKRTWRLPCKRLRKCRAGLSWLRGEKYSTRCRFPSRAS